MRAFAISALAALLATVSLLVAGPGGGLAAGGQGQTALTITFWSDGPQRSEPDVWTLRCAPPRGTHPKPAVSCRRLAAGGWKLVVPVREGAICTEIYGGPQEARVVGTLDGRRIWARFTRQNGCQISRWDRLSPWLFPAGGVR
jgi:Subtilisin inhibitor-like